MQWFRHIGLASQSGLGGRFESYPHDSNTTYCYTIVLLLEWMKINVVINWSILIRFVSNLSCSVFIVFDIPLHNSTSQLLSFSCRSMVHKFNTSFVALLSSLEYNFSFIYQTFLFSTLLPMCVFSFMHDSPHHRSLYSLYMDI